MEWGLGQPSPNYRHTFQGRRSGCERRILLSSVSRSSSIRTSRSLNHGSTVPSQANPKHLNPFRTPWHIGSLEAIHSATSFLVSHNPQKPHSTSTPQNPTKMKTTIIPTLALILLPALLNALPSNNLFARDKPSCCTEAVNAQKIGDTTAYNIAIAVRLILLMSCL